MCRRRLLLHLSGDVAITTRDGDTLRANAITVMEIVNRQTHKAEQRLQCDEGATIGRREVRIVANRMRYSIRDHTAELLDGVRATFKAGSFQSQRCFWSLEENIVRIPDPSSGMLDDNRFRAERVTLDLANDCYTATNGKLSFKSDPELTSSIRNAIGMRPK